MGAKSTTRSYTSIVASVLDKVRDKVEDQITRNNKLLYFYKKNQLPERPASIRPILWLGAFLALTLRGSLFIVKNKLDKIKRRLAR